MEKKYSSGKEYALEELLRRHKEDLEQYPILVLDPETELQVLRSQVTDCEEQYTQTKPNE